jgi:hypothetical protein
MTMVELQTSPYDYEGIPLVYASIVSIDAELSLEEDPILTAHAIPSTPISIAVPSPTRVAEESTPTSSMRSVEPSAPSFHEQQENDQQSQQTEETRQQNRTTQQPQTEEDRERERTVGAGAAGSVFGLLLGGPFLAFLFGFGTAYYTKQEGPSGDMARAIGDVALVARDKFREVDGKHHIVDKGKVAAAEAIDKIQQADQTHQLKERLYQFLSWCWNSTLEFAQRHHLIERGSAKVKRLLNKLVEKITENQDRVASGQSTSGPNETRR